MARLAWKLKRLVNGQTPNGYQFTAAGLEALWAQVPPLPVQMPVLNCFQLYPPSLVRQQRPELGYYIDMTLHQLFHYYGLGEHLPIDVATEALALERAQLAMATHIVVHTRWVAQDLVATYGLAPERISVVVPGANFVPAEMAYLERLREARSYRTGARAFAPLKLLFVGKDWKRKGLDRLISALSIANARKAIAHLTVVGVRRADVPHFMRHANAVTWHGFLDKRRDAAKLLQICLDADVGVLLSRREAGGLSLLEFARLGLPTIAPLTGGSPEFTIEGATTLVSATAPDRQIADVITALATDQAHLQRQRTIAMERRTWADWGRAANELSDILKHSA